MKSVITMEMMQARVSDCDRDLSKLENERDRLERLLDGNRGSIRFASRELRRSEIDLAFRLGEESARAEKKAGK